MDTHDDNFEFAISQAVDGTLSDHDRFALGERLRSPDADRLASEHARLTAMLRGNDLLPPIDFDGFAASIAAAVALEDDHAPASLPIRPTWTRRLAVAAAVILSVLAAWPLLPKRSGPPAVATGSVTVEGPTATALPTTPPVTQIAIGPSDSMVARGQTASIDVQRPQHVKAQVVISSVDTNADLRPY